MSIRKVNTGLSDVERGNFVRPKKIVIKKRKKNDTKNQKRSNIKYFLTIYISDRNYSKLYKFCRYTIRKVWTWYGSFLHNLEIGQKFNCF